MRLFYLLTIFFSLWHSSCKNNRETDLSNTSIDRFLGIESSLPFRGFGEEIIPPSPSRKPPKTKITPLSYPQCANSMSFYLPSFPLKLESTSDSEFVIRSTGKWPDWDLQFETTAHPPNGKELTPRMKEVCQYMEENLSKGISLKFSEVFNRSQIQTLFKNNDSLPLTIRYFLTIPPFSEGAETLFEFFTPCNFTVWNEYTKSDPKSEVPYVNVVDTQSKCPFSISKLGLHDDEDGMYAVAIDGEFQPSTSKGLKITIKRIYFDQKTISQ